MNVGEELQQGQHAYALKQAWYWDQMMHAFKRQWGLQGDKGEKRDADVVHGPEANSESDDSTHSD